MQDCCIQACVISCNARHHKFGTENHIVRHLAERVSHPVIFVRYPWYVGFTQPPGFIYVGSAAPYFSFQAFRLSGARRV